MKGDKGISCRVSMKQMINVYERNVSCILPLPIFWHIGLDLEAPPRLFDSGSILRHRLTGIHRYGMWHLCAIYSMVYYTILHVCIAVGVLKYNNRRSTSKAILLTMAQTWRNLQRSFHLENYEQHSLLYHLNSTTSSAQSQTIQQAAERLFPFLSISAEPHESLVRVLLRENISLGLSDIVYPLLLFLVSQLYPLFMWLEGRKSRIEDGEEGEDVPDMTISKFFFASTSLPLAAYNLPSSKWQW
jgi:hypothetical protein